MSTNLVSSYVKTSPCHCNWIRTSNHLVRKWTLSYSAIFNHLTIWPIWLNGSVFVYQRSDCGFKSRSSHLNFRYHVCVEQGVLDIQATTECRFNLKRVCGTIRTYSLLAILAWYIFEYIYLHKFQVNVLLKKHLSRGHRILCFTHHLGRTDNKPFSGLIGPRYMAASRAVKHQSGVTRCAPRNL